MQPQQLVSILVQRWRTLKGQGRVVSAEELCAGHPELLEAVRRGIHEVSLISQETLNLPESRDSSAALSQDEPTGLPSNSHGTSAETVDPDSTLDPAPALSAADDDTLGAAKAPADDLTVDMPAGARPQVIRQRVPGYEMLSELGRGGMGVVYKAKQLSLKRLVALKMILAGDDAGAEHLERFRREAEAVAHLQHPNIVHIHEIGEHQGRPYFSLEFVDGGSLVTKVRGHVLPAEQSARLIETLARAVQHAHQRGVVHRDLKPANILLQEVGDGGPASHVPGACAIHGEHFIPKITDFGLAKRLESQDMGQTRSGAVIGTPSYMAPEQAEGRTAAIGPLVDVYALGAILYELLTGKPPFRGDSIMTTLQKVAHEDPPPPSKVQPRVNRDLETICLKALAKDPTKRYPSALAMAQDLERFLAGEPIMARREWFVSKVLRKVRRSPAMAAALAGLLLAVGIATAAFLGVSSSRQLNALQRDFDAGLDAKEWPPPHRDKLEALIADIESLDPAQAVLARQRMVERFASRITQSLRQARLAPAEVERLEAEVAWLRERDAAQAAILAQAVKGRLSQWQTIFDLQAPFEHVKDTWPDARIKIDGGVLALDPPKNKKQSVLPTRVFCPGMSQLEAFFEHSWEQAFEVGLVLNLHDEANKGQQGYAFVLSAEEPPIASLPLDKSAAKTPEPAPSPPSFEEVRRRRGKIRMRILRNGQVQRDEVIVVAAGPLRLSARRERDTLQFQVNDAAPLVFHDAFPLRVQPGAVFAVQAPSAIRLTRLRGLTQALPTTPSPLERGDDFYDKGQMDDALTLYQEQAALAVDPEVKLEARCKSGLCLVALNRLEEAAQVFSPAVLEQGERWPLLAASQLFIVRLKQNKLDDIDALRVSLANRFRYDQLTVHIPAEVRSAILALAQASVEDYLLSEPAQFRRVEQSIALAELFHDDNQRIFGNYTLARMHFTRGEERKALELAKESWKLMVDTGRSDDPFISTFPMRVLTWLMRRQGETAAALKTIDAHLFEKPGIYRPYRQRTPYEEANQRPWQRDPYAHLPFLMERCRVNAALGDWSQAERDVDDFLKLNYAHCPNYPFVANAWLLKGFLRERLGDEAGAQSAWKDGPFASFVERSPPDLREHIKDSRLGEGLVVDMIMGSLTNTLTDKDAEAIYNGLAARFASNSTTLQIATAVRLSPEIFRDMWRTPRGKELARKVAFLDLPQAEYFHHPLYLAVLEKFKREALRAPVSAEEDEMVWTAMVEVGDDFFAGKLSKTQALQLALAFKGTTNFLGWAGVAPKLPPRQRGPIAYVLGHRSLRTTRPDDALMYFRTASADAAPGSPLARLARAEEERLSKK